MALAQEFIVAATLTDKEPRKVLRFAVSGDGSIGMLAPYHPAKTGVLAELRLPGRLERGAPAHLQAIYRVEAPVKLSVLVRADPGDDVDGILVVLAQPQFHVAVPEAPRRL